MVVPPAGGPGPASGTTSTFRVSPAAHIPANIPPQNTARGRMGNGASQGPNGAHINGTTSIPLSVREDAPLDLSTVERRGQANAAREVSRPGRMFGLLEAPVFRPTEEEWKDPMAYMDKIADEGRKYGIVKIIPPDDWNPTFSIDTERFHFKTRRQELNSVEGGTRANLNYLDQLAKFHRQQGTNLNRFPSVDKRPLDLYKLKRAVETRGGFERVCKGKKWAEIGRDLGYSGKIMSSLSTSLKNSYAKWLHPYEEYLKDAKPGVQKIMEYEQGGPYTPSPSPMKKSASQQQTPTSHPAVDSPAIRASTALHASLQDVHIHTPTPSVEPLRPQTTSGFTAVNAGGFTAVNAPPPPNSATPSFPAVNMPGNGLARDNEPANSTPLRATDSPMPMTSSNTPDLRPSAFGASTPLSNGHGPSSLKRQHSDGEGAGTNGESDSAGRRSKRLRSENAPTITGSHMSQPRIQPPRYFTPRDRSKEKPGELCEICHTDDDPTAILLCDSCDVGCHRYCLDPPLPATPEYDWYCSKCLVGTGEFGFEEGGIYSLRQFQDKANRFKEAHFAPHVPTASKEQFDPIHNASRPIAPITEDMVEKEFWRLVENIQESVEVEYGADIHSTTHGSGFPTLERSPRDPYTVDPWNLNRLPLIPESLFRFIKTNISGMTVPWLYVGMVFSTFCWHAEDHYTYSANYQHFGATKTWYGIPAEDAEKFENAMRDVVPELFEAQPDLLFQLVTLLTPAQLQKAGVRVYAVDQRAGQMVVTFPQAYHAGFNHGFNFNEAVNFAPYDWEPYGEAGAIRLQDYRRQPCFSHDELLINAASQKDTTIKTAKWLAPALRRMLNREFRLREQFIARHQATQEHKNCATTTSGFGDAARSDTCQMKFEVSEEELPEDGYSCAYCKGYAYLSRFYCRLSKKVMCLEHAGHYECCVNVEPVRFLGIGKEHELVFRMTNEALESMVHKIVDKASVPDLWAEKLNSLVDDDPKPPLKALRSLLIEGEKIQWELPDLPDLRKFVERCNKWVDDAQGYITRKQQNRRKTERSWGRRASGKAVEDEKEYRNIDRIFKLLKQAEDISFECPEIAVLKERADSIADFQKKAAVALNEQLSAHRLHSVAELDELVEVGRSFNVDIPEVEELDKLAQRRRWYEEARQRRNVQNQTIEGVALFIAQGKELGIPETDTNMLYLEEEKRQGEMWDAKANELISAENVHYQQLDALSKQASTVPVTPATLQRIDEILKKQRDAQEQIMALYERSKNEDFEKRPKYREVKDAMDALDELNSKPTGTLDLEKELKRHEDWMRKGKKLFGKANAPLHILLNHMNLVEQKNVSCFDIYDQPRVPVEPASRANTPDENENIDGSNSVRDVFCICRRPEAGMMIECEVCHEWYHGKCLKIARGKVKEDDKYTCPICDHRVRIPRDAARPKLEDLQAWQDEIPGLPFQPEEEETLESIISYGQDFREFVKQYVNPVLSSPDVVDTQRFYLRKLEGADILLADEINFFRKELHRWMPLADKEPPTIDVSLSTRKPRPTKLQKVMAQYNVTNIDDLPAHARPKQTQTLKRKQSEGTIAQASTSQAPAEPSHTPPGMPATTGGYFDTASNAVISPQQNSPMFATNAVRSPPPFTTTSQANLEATMFGEDSHRDAGNDTLNIFKDPDPRDINEGGNLFGSDDNPPEGDDSMTEIFRAEDGA